MSVIIDKYRAQFIKRYNCEEHLKYFTHKDFDGLCREDIEFKSAQGNTLRGGIYNYNEYDPSVLVIFCHGIGPGHISYMREIEYLCKNGFRVLAYDNTGCNESDGEDIRGLSQSLADLTACMEYISKNDALSGKRLFVMGHSWGGFAAGNIPNYCDKVEKVVVISGFVSLKQLMKQYFKGAASIFKHTVLKYEKKQNPACHGSCSADAYNKGKVKALVLQSEDDPLVYMQSGIDYLKATVVSGNVRYIVTADRKHNPNYTADAVKYMLECFSAVAQAEKSGKLDTAEQKRQFADSFDWYRMTAQDDEIWKEIIGFLK